MLLVAKFVVPLKNVVLNALLDALVTIAPPIARRRIGLDDEVGVIVTDIMSMCVLLLTSWSAVFSVTSTCKILPAGSAPVVIAPDARSALVMLPSGSPPTASPAIVPVPLIVIAIIRRSPSWILTVS